MKETEPQNVFIVILLVFSCIITIYSFIITTGGIKSAGKSTRVPVIKLESFNGQSEFYYKPAGEKRVWHVVNVYSEFNPLNDNFHNMSYYEFNSDSVLVINQYAFMPDQNQQEIGDANDSQIKNNFNN